MYGCESWTIKKAACRRIWCFQLWCWVRLLRVSWTARRSNQSILKEISPEYSLEELMLMQKCQYPGPLMWRANSLEKTWCWEWLKAGGERHHRFNGRDFEQALGDSEGQASLACCSPQGYKELDTTEWLNDNPWLKCSTTELGLEHSLARNQI